jgi:hypothetical protein
VTSREVGSGSSAGAPEALLDAKKEGGGYAVVKELGAYVP